MNADSLRGLLQQVIDERKAEGRDASYRNLQELVEAEEQSNPRGLALNRTTASQIVKGTYKGVASPGTVRAIAWLAGVSEAAAFTAAGQTPPGPPFATELPPGVDDLSPKERRAAIEMLRTLVAQRQEINRHESAAAISSPPESRTPGKAEREIEEARAGVGQRKPDGLIEEPQGTGLVVGQPTPDDGAGLEVKRQADYDLANRNVGTKSKRQLQRERDDRLGEESQVGE